MEYRVQVGDSPASIARKFSLPIDDLLAANPQKLLNVIAGMRTWQSIVPGEIVKLPIEIPRLADVASKALAAVNPCDQANASLVCDFQRSLGRTPDGKYGTDTAHALAALIPSAPAGCHPRPAWWAPHGGSNCGAVMIMPTASIKALPPLPPAMPAVLPAMAPWLAGVRFYQVLIGDSPAIIAQKFGVPLDALISSNPQKPTNVVAGVRTWQSISPGEYVNVPIISGSGTVGDEASDTAARALAAINPCDQDYVDVVCDFQRAVGLNADGKYGTDTSHALAKLVSNAPSPCHPKPDWWAPSGQSNCATAATVAPAATVTSDLSSAASAALAALNADPNYCASVRQTGSTVNTAVHAFKSAWNAANPGNRVPIGTGNYEQSVADALSSATSQTAPSGCGAAAPAPTPPAPPPPPAPTPTPAAVATPAAQALAAVNPCKQENVGLVWAFQQSVGQEPDGKYGSDTAHALADQIPNAPAGCHPRPDWWAPTGQKNFPGAAPLPPLPPSPPGPEAIKIQKTKEAEAALVTPTKPEGIGTGTLAVVGIGAVSLIGVVAIAMKKPVVQRVYRRAAKGAKGAYGKVARKVSRKKR